MRATSREVAEAVHSEELKRFFRFRADGDSKAALKELEASAAKGNAEAMWELGFAMHTGELMLEKNPGKAFELYKASAEQGFVRAMAEHAMCLWFGVGCAQQDRKAAQIWVEKVFESNDHYAKGVLFYYGVGIPVNRNLAHFEFLRASDLAEAQHFLGQIYNDLGNPTEALLWYEKAAVQGVSRAQEIARSDDMKARIELANQCAFCPQRSSLKLCSGCNAQKYCSPQCQKRHWSKHKRQCIVTHFGFPTVPEEQDNTCPLYVLARSFEYSFSELTDLEQCRFFLRKLSRVPVCAVSNSRALVHFSASKNGYVSDGDIQCFRGKFPSRLFTFGVATCAVVIICGKDGRTGEAVGYLQHLSGLNYRGQPKAGVCRDLGKLLGGSDSFLFESGCIIPGQALNNELTSPVVDPLDPALQFLIWEQFKSFTWRTQIELWTGLQAGDKIELLVSPARKINVYSDPVNQALYASFCKRNPLHA